MLCSTIIPTVNRPSLERTVNSVLSQGLGQEIYEIIIVNDSGQILPESDWLKSPQIKVVNTNRCDRCFARNVGATVATGKYLHFLDDDDYILPRGVQILLLVAETSNCDWTYGAHNRVDDEGRLISVNSPNDKGNLFGLLVAGETIHMGPSLIKREAFFKVGGFDPKLRTAQDRDLECQIALTGDFDCTDQLVAAIRVGPTGNTTTDWGTAKQNNQLIREKALNAPDALNRILDSIGNRPYLRGRLCRAYMFSAGLNLRAGRFFTACSRLFPLLRLASFYPMMPIFWHGLLFRPYWHNLESQQEEKQYEAGLSPK